MTEIRCICSGELEPHAFGVMKDSWVEGYRCITCLDFKPIEEDEDDYDDVVEVEKCSTCFVRFVKVQGEMKQLKGDFK